MRNILLLSIVTPLIGSLFILLLRKKSWMPLLALFLAGATFFWAGKLIFPLMRGETFISYYFIADGLSVFFAVVSSLVGALIVLYSREYMKSEENSTEFYFIIMLFMSSMLGLVFSAHLLLIYIFWEIAAICSWRLIGFYRREKDIAAAHKAFLITFAAASIMLVGFIMIYLETGTFSLSELPGTPISNLPFLFIFIGIMAKSCIFPLHTWLPGAGVAPAPVTALLHAAVLVKIGIYGFARFFPYTFPLPQAAADYVPVLAVISAVVAGCVALRETDIKRILAYSTISQLGFMFVGLALVSVTGLTGALLFVLAHALGKAGLFLCAGIIERKTGTKDTRELGGMMKTLPITGIVFSLCALSVAGIPPLTGFWGKLLLVMAPIKEGRFLLAGAVILSCILTLLYLLRLFNQIFLGETTHPQAREGFQAMLISVSILAALSLLGGVLIAFPGELIEIIREQLLAISGG